MGIKELQAKEKEIRGQVYKAQVEREKELLPIYRKEFIGKCFKYRNSYGGDRPKWWLYLKIIDVESVNFHNDEEPIFKALTFQSPLDNSVDIGIQCYAYVRKGEYTPISKSEFESAKKSFLVQAKKYLLL